jgi:arylformamidase
MRIYDITVPLGCGTHIWDDRPGPALTFECSIAEGDFANVTNVAMGSHSGTHTDAPSHFVADGLTVDRLPPETLVGTAIVVQYEGTSDISADDIDDLGNDGRHQRVLFKTPNAGMWEAPTFRRDFIGLDEGAAERLIGLGVKLVAMDYLSIEAYAAGDDAPVHRRLMAAGVVILEGADLRDVPPGEYLLVCAPIKLVGAEGAPTRAFLIEGR